MKICTNKLMYICFIFIFSLNLDAKVIELVAQVTYENTSQKEVNNIKHKVTIPENRYYQTLKEIYITPIDKYKVKKRKKYDSKYVELDFGTLKKGEIKTKNIHFVIEMKEIDMNFENEIFQTNTFANEFLKQTDTLEIQSKEIQSISYLINQSNVNLLSKVKLAFEFPSKYLDYQIQKKTTALTALKTGIGDCTEFAMLFISLARNLGIEARRVAVFNFAKRNEFEVPNHHIAEIYTKKYGWVPLYPNLSAGGKKEKYGFGKISKNILLYKYKTWTWSRNFDNKSDKNIAKTIKTNMKWIVK